MLYALTGSEGLIGLFSDRTIALIIAREWLRMQRADGRGVRTVVLHMLDDDRRLVREQLPDVVILDVRLPDGSGLDLAAELPPPGAADRPKIVIMSASVLPSDRRAAEESGSDAFMGKPFIPRDLIAVLERLVRADASDPAGR